jgi:hypothetical protein
MTEELEKARSHFCRQIAACWLDAMAYRKLDLAAIAERIGASEPVLNHALHELVDGRSEAVTIEMLSDIMSAMGMQIELKLTKRVFIQPIEEPPSEATRTDQQGTGEA